MMNVIQLTSGNQSNLRFMAKITLSLASRDFNEITTRPHHFEFHLTCRHVTLLAVVPLKFHKIIKRLLMRKVPDNINILIG
jgi:hypothetical protein